MKHIKFKLNEKEQKLPVVGNVSYGDEVVLLEQDDNLIKSTDFNHNGFSINKFLDNESYLIFCDGIKDLMSELILKATGILVPKDFELEQYHHLINSDSLHAKIVAYLRDGFELQKLPIMLGRIEKRVSEICRVDVVAFNKNLKDQNFYIRVVRPDGKNDNNPPHRDVWLDYYRNCVNIYLPICGVMRTLLFLWFPAVITGVNLR